jgi:hypothetical protein
MRSVPSVAAAIAMALCLLCTCLPLWADDNASTPEPKQAARKPIPEKAAQRQAEKLIRDIFKKEFAERSTEARKALAQKLLQQASQTTDDEAARFVLLREARDLGVKVGDAEIIVKAVESMAGEFDVNGVKMKKDHLDKGSRNDKTEESQRGFAEAFMKIADEAMVKNDYRTATSAARSAVTCAKKAKDVSLTRDALKKSKEIVTIERQWRTAKKAAETLKQNPDDPRANSVVGKFFCLIAGRWDWGLSNLVKGSDEELKDAAAKDLMNPKDATKQVTVGDSWWDLAKKEQGLAQRNVQDRAVYWYKKALPKLSGLTKARVEKRLEELLIARLAPAERRLLGKYVCAYSKAVVFEIVLHPNHVIEELERRPPESEARLKATGTWGLENGVVVAKTPKNDRTVTLSPTEDGKWKGLWFEGEAKQGRWGKVYVHEGRK